ncbi:L-aspartate oxidase [Flavobacterium sp.]|uniref:L-aspartate oxidase n=1 Tax=Flavobacterium sp. TaxID=239 RepID=UPI002606CE30|nr:L-aspartate oxidase [Flavobacterium sp.]MDD3005276.1 L-aspartate oxidase [Flavobacterium sp.]
METDYLILGSGIAGLTVALKLAQEFPDRKILIVTKSNADESNTKYAQGGIAVVIDGIDDDFEKHINDTLVCGDGLCNREVVKMVVKEGPKRLKELIDWGTNFDLTIDGNLDLAKEGGHSNHRVVHHKDQTGREIERAILAEAYQKKNIKILDFHFATDLITESNCCYGTLVLDEKNGRIIPIYAHFTILATGGIGQLYKQTTNPLIATGDGIAMAIRTNAIIKDMEFIQFHPTALYMPKATSTFLISEAVRGFGASLKTKKGRRFMLDYDARGELASRDIVSRSIETELKKSENPCVYLDCTHLDILAFKNHFPTIYENCLLSGIDVTKDWIPVIPTQHYLCGGISVDKNGMTSVENLFACGECSHTGLHGANRLASNSLLEALVYSNQIFNFLKKTDLKNNTKKMIISDDFTCKNKSLDKKIIAQFKEDLQKCMQKNVGIVRNNTDLEKTLEQLLIWEKECQEMESKYRVTKDFWELKNMITVSIPIVAFSLKRTENKGSFFKEQKL